MFSTIKNDLKVMTTEKAMFAAISRAGLSLNPTTISRAVNEANFVRKNRAGRSGVAQFIAEFVQNAAK